MDSSLPLSMADVKKTTVFLRESTGLVKNVSLIDVITLNMSNMSAGAALAVVGFTMLLLAQFATVSGVNIAAASAIAFLISIPQIIVYTMMTRRISRTGGDYVWISRTFGGFAGNVSALMGYTFGNLPFFSLIAISAVFAIGAVGLTLGNQSFLGLALPGNIPGADTTSQFILASLLFVILIAINILKPKAGYRLVSVLMIIGVAATILAVITLLAAGRTGVINYMNSLGNSSLTYNAVANSYSGETFNLGNTLLMVPYFAFFTYPWINAGPGVATEIKGKSALRWNVPIASFLVFLLTTGSFATMYYVGGYNFITAALSNPNLVNNFSFNFWTLAMGASGSTIIAAIIGVGWILWLIAILAYGIIVFSRYLFAQAFDRFLPGKLAYVSPKYGSPVIAHLIFLAVTVTFVAGAAFIYGTLTSLFGIIVANMAYFGIVGLAGATWGARKEKGRARTTLIVAGVLQAIVFSWLIYQFLALGSVWGANPLAYGYVLTTISLGIVIYFVSKAYHKARGVDITLAFKEIPPE